MGLRSLLDHAPRLPGDGYLFYNFAVEGKDKAFLAKFLPAIKRTIREVRHRPTEKLLKSHDGKGRFIYTVEDKRRDMRN